MIQCEDGDITARGIIPSNFETVFHLCISSGIHVRTEESHKTW